MTRTSELVAIGTRDITPPEGRVTLELRSANTGRLRKRVEVDNALMDWYKAAVPRNGGRGGFYQSPGPAPASTFSGLSSGINPTYFAQLTSPFTPVISEQAERGQFDPTRWPSIAGVAKNCTNWLWATNQNVTPDAAAFHIPTLTSEVTAGVQLASTAYAAVGIQNKRGAINQALTSWTWDRIRMVVDFATAEGNGTYRSVGIGMLLPETIAPGRLRSFPAPMLEYNPVDVNQRIGSQLDSGMLTTLTHASTGQAFNYWLVDSAFNLIHRSYQSTTGTTLFTVSAANLPGSGGPLGPVIEHTPSDFWIARNQTLYRCVAPVSNAAITPVNTYNLSGTLGAEAILDITFDGTNLYLLTLTQVYVVNPATGGITSNWAHGRSGGTLGNQSIMWDAGEQLLWINFVNTSGTTRSWEWGLAGSGTQVATDVDSLICYGYTLGGVVTKAHMARHGGPSNASQVHVRLLGAARSDGQFWSRLGFTGNQCRLWLNGPSMATHALLPSDVVKTSDDILRITYDFNFA